MPTPANKPMRKLIIAGTFAQYMDWLSLKRANPLAAPYIRRGADLREYDPDEDEIVLVGTYHDNPAYQSNEYRQFVWRSAIAV